MTPPSAADLLARVRAGDAAAADELFDRYARQLAGVARQSLNPRLARRIDGEDVVQSVFRTFFRRCAAGEFHIDSSGQLWRLLLTITLRKAAAQARRHTAGNRTINAESGDEWLAEAVTRDPGPAEAAALQDLVVAILEGLPDEHARILELRLAGHSVAEVASELKLTRQSVYRVMKLLQHRLEEKSGDDGGQIGPAAQ